MFLCRFISHLPLEPRRADPAVTGCCWGELAAGCSWCAVAVLHVTRKDFSGCLGRAGGKRPPRSLGQPRAHPRAMPKHKPGQLWLCAAKSCKSPWMVMFNLSWELFAFPKVHPELQLVVLVPSHTSGNTNGALAPSSFNCPAKSYSCN